MRTKLIETNLPERFIHVIFNADTVTIPTGTPVVLALNATQVPSTPQNGKPAGFQDGMAVVLPSTAGGGSYPGYTFLAYGVCLGSLAVNQIGEAIVHGVVNYALVTINTRAGSASTNSWSAVAVITGGVALVLDTVNNAFVTSSAPVLGQPVVVLLDNVASQAASATTATDTRTAILKGCRVFVREM